MQNIANRGQTWKQMASLLGYVNSFDEFIFLIDFTYF